MENDMETKDAKGPVTAAEAVKVDAIDSITELYTTGIERLAEVQKKGLEIAVKHNADVASRVEKVHAAGTGRVDAGFGDHRV